MKKSVCPLKRPVVVTEQESMAQKRQSKSTKSGIVPQTAEKNKLGRSKIVEKSAANEVIHTSLTNDEEAAFIKQNRYYMKDENVLGLGIEERKVDGKEKYVLVFLVQNGKKAHEIPKHVWLEANCGKRIEIATAVEQSGKIVPLRAEAGDAVKAVDPPNVFGPTTIGAIMPFPNSDDPVRLLTSAHLIDYDEKHKGKLLYYFKRKDYDKQQPRSSFPNPELELFPVTNFYPVEKHDHPLTWEEEQMVTRNKLDVLWADVSFEVSDNKITSRIAGRHPEGIRAPQRGEYFNLYGLSSGMHRAKVLSTMFDGVIEHTHTEKRTQYYTYWQSLVRFKDERPFLPGDSGSALVSDDGYVIGLLSFGDEEGNGYACQLQET